MPPETTKTSDDPDSDETTTHMHRKTTTTSSPDSEETTTPMHRTTTTPSDDTTTPDSVETTTQMHRKTTTASNTPDSEETTTQMHRETTTPSDDTPDPHSVETTTRMHRKTITPSDDTPDPHSVETTTRLHRKTITPTPDPDSEETTTQMHPKTITPTPDPSPSPHSEETTTMYPRTHTPSTLEPDPTSEETTITPSDDTSTPDPHPHSDETTTQMHRKTTNTDDDDEYYRKWDASTCAVYKFTTSGEKCKSFSVLKKSISFKVQTARNAIVTLITSPRFGLSMIEIILGRDGNTKTSVKKDNLSITEIIIETPGLLNDQDYVGFWIEWLLDGHIAIGHEGDKDSFIEYIDCPGIEYVEMETPTSDGRWVIKANDVDNDSNVPNRAQLLKGTGPSQLDEDVKKILDDHASLIKKSEKNSIESIGSYFDRLIL